MGFLSLLRIGNGTLEPTLKAELEDEGLVLLEEGLSGRIRYTHFRAPGRRFHGKITPERIGFAISEARAVAYCRSGNVKLIDTAFSNPRARMLDPSVKDADTVAIRIDYDQAGEPNVSGVITIELKSPNAARIVDELRARFGQA